MPADLPPHSAIEALNYVLTEDELRSWVLRWQNADASTRMLMETEAGLKGLAFARLDPDRFAERRQVAELFRREGLEGDRSEQ